MRRLPQAADGPLASITFLGDRNATDASPRIPDALCRGEASRASAPGISMLARADL